MKQIIFIVLITLFSNSFSQSRKLDSLLRLVETTRDTQQVNVLNQISLAYFKVSDFDQSIKHAQQALEYSEKLLFKRGIAESYYNIGSSYAYQGQTENALRVFASALNIYQEIGHKKGIFCSNNTMAGIYTQQGKYKEAFSYFFKALKIQEEIGDDVERASILHNMGTMFMYQNNYTTALEYYYKALIIREKEKVDKKGLSMSYNGIGSVYYTQKNFSGALNYFLKALIIEKAIFDKDGMATSYNNIGLVYEDMCVSESNKKTAAIYLEKALNSYLKALEIKKEIGDDFGISICLGNIGSNYANQGDLEIIDSLKYKKYNKALTYHIKAFEINKKRNDVEGTTISSTAISALYLKLNNLDKALYFANVALSSSKEINYKSALSDLYEVLSEVYIKKHDYKQASNYQQLSSVIKDSLFSERSSEQIAEMNAKYETTKKEEEINSLKKDAEINNLIVKNHKTKILILILSFFFIIIIAILLFNRYKFKQKALTSQTLAKERIQTIIETTETERRNIAKDLHDSVGALMSAAKFSIQNVLVKYKEEELKKDLLNTSELITKSVAEVRNISHQMSPKIVVQFGVVAAINELLENTSMCFEFKHPEATKRYNETIELCLYRVTQESINNILKHASATIVTIELTEKNNLILLRISDNGKGFTQEFSSSGHGMENMKLRVSAVNGEFWIDTQESGTSINAQIPI